MVKNGLFLHLYFLLNTSLDPGYLGDTPILVDINKVDGLKVPTGNESGAWQGLWEPGGFTNGGIPEAVVNQIQGGTYTVTDVFK